MLLRVNLISLKIEVKTDHLDQAHVTIFELLRLLVTSATFFDCLIAQCQSLTLKSKSGG